MKFCTTVNCMDGRVQLPVINFLMERYGAEYIDSITEPGPIRILAEQTSEVLVESIYARLHISFAKHGSTTVAVVGHYDCAGNPVPKDAQIEQIAVAMKHIAQRFDSVEIVGLWVDENWEVTELPPAN